MRLLPALVLLLAVPALAQGTAADAPTAGLGLLLGVVTDAETGAPVVGAGVVIPALGIGAVSQRDGRYAIEGVPEGSHEVRVGAYRYHLDPMTTVVVAGATAHDVALRPGAGVGCAVVHEHGPDGSHMSHPRDADDG